MGIQWRHIHCEYCGKAITTDNKDKRFCNNKCSNKFNAPRYEYKGKNLTSTEWAHELSTTPGTIKNRLRMGWTIERIVETPVREKFPRYEYKGKKYTMRQLAELSNVDMPTLWRRMQNMPIEKAMAYKRPKKKNIYTAVAPNGKVFKSKRCKPNIGRVDCKRCGLDVYWNTHKGGKMKPQYCNPCSAMVASEIHAIKKRLRHSVQYVEIKECISQGCNGLYNALERKTEEDKGYCSIACARKNNGGKKRFHDTLNARMYESYWPYEKTNCKYCGKWTLKAQPSPGGAFFCSEECRHTQKKLLKNSGHRSRARRYGVEYETGINLNTLIKKKGRTCSECGITVQIYKGTFGFKGLSPEIATIGHIKPMSKGGGHTWDNVQVECWACNTWKGNTRTTIDWGSIMEAGGEWDEQAA